MNQNKPALDNKPAQADIAEVVAKVAATPVAKAPASASLKAQPARAKASLSDVKKSIAVAKPKTAAAVSDKSTASTKPPGARPAAVKKTAAAKPASTVKKIAMPVSPKAEVKAKPASVVKEKAKKAKLVRDSFTMPEAEYEVLGQVKKACLKAGIDIKKSELLRVGVALIKEMDLAHLKTVLAALPQLKMGRPKKI
ncbi:MAG: hypothetical protein V4805_10745 [Pseudomonadota bacterium]